MQGRRGTGGQPEWPPMMGMHAGMGPATVNMGSMLPVSQSSHNMCTSLKLQEHKLLILSTDNRDALFTPVDSTSIHWTIP